MQAFIEALLVGLFLLVLAVVPVHYLSKYTCSKRAEVYETEYHYGFLEGCFLERDGKLIHEDHYRYME